VRVVGRQRRLVPRQEVLDVGVRHIGHPSTLRGRAARVSYVGRARQDVVAWCSVLPDTVLLDTRVLSRRRGA
jgi:hypothetical protein